MVDRSKLGKWLLIFFVVGGIMGVILLATNAPLWVYYVAPLAVMPLLVLALRQIER